MSKLNRRSILGIGLASTLPSLEAGFAAAAAAATGEIKSSAGKGVTFLKGTQEADGSWQHYPGITGICALGLLRSGLTVKDAAVRRACDYLLSQAKPNGAIYTEALGPAQALPNYNTALSLNALAAAKDARYAEAIRNAQHFLSVSQFDEEEGYTPKDPQYGGFGYGVKQGNGDLSNLQTVLESLHESAYPKDAPLFKKAITFLQRCQNRSESNDQKWAANDGGFIYAASGESKADEYTKQAHSSYGSMTYAGVKSYLYCSVTKSDARVQSAWNWLRANYEVDQNPRMGSDGLFYYYHTMSKTLAIWGERVVTDIHGQKHPWATDLAGAIVRRQRPDGSWVNTNARWRENNPVLVTGYSLLSLANCARGV